VRSGSNALRLSGGREGTMALRAFLDSAGNEWLAFDVIPRADERRRLDRRLLHETRSQPRDRRDADRRFTVGGRSPLVRGVADGWLCFERGTERRRLWPIPECWPRCSDVELESYCQSARPVRRESGSADEMRQARAVNR
jgi:hypothetical protein